MEKVKVIVRFANGKLIKGYTNDFFPKKPFFHVGTSPLDQGTEVAVKDMKALFFVRNFLGDPTHDSKQRFDEGQPYQGKKAEITFLDGEKLVGTVLSYDRERPAFFLVPVDEEDNNTRVFVVSAAVKEIKFL